MSTLPTEADALALDLIESCGRPERIVAIAARLTTLAARIREQETVAIPAHLREPPRRLPPGVVALCGRRAR